MRSWKTCNGELGSTDGFVSNAGAQGSALLELPIREHLLKEGYAWAASSYRCNGYYPQGLDTIALTELFTKSNGGIRAPQRGTTGTSMGGHVTLLGMRRVPRPALPAASNVPAGPEPFDFFAATGGARK